MLFLLQTVASPTVVSSVEGGGNIQNQSAPTSLLLQQATLPQQISLSTLGQLLFFLLKFQSRSV